MGIVHGLAGTGALVLVAVSSSNSFLEGALFIVLFGIGSMFGMAVLGALVGLVMKYARQFKKINTGMQAGAGVLSIVVGAFLIYESSLINLIATSR